MTVVAPAHTRHAGVWAAIVGVLVAVGIAAALLSAVGQSTRRGAMDPQSTGPDGTRALARVLDTHGVHVDTVHDPQALQQALAAARPAAGRPARATLVLPDSPLVTAAQLRALSRAAADVVVLQPQARSLRMLFGARPDGSGAGGLTAPGCTVAAARRAGPLRPGALFAFTAGTPARVTACYRTGSAAALLRVRTAGTTVVAVDGTALVTNERLARDGNAALGVNLLGAHGTVIWYVPSQPQGTAATPTLGDLTPPWVSPVIVLLLVAGLAAALWRGRRFGPLVAENLPVTVRAGETTDGRARLYARSGDAAHAAGLLRADAVGRLSHRLGQGVGGDPGAVADAAADLAGMPRAAVRALLTGAAPRAGRDLATLADRLDDLERRVDAAARPDSGRMTP